MRHLAQNDPCYTENIGFTKYLMTVADQELGVIHDIGHHGKIISIDDPTNKATLFVLKNICDSDIGILGDTLTVNFGHPERRALEKLDAVGLKRPTAAFHRKSLLPSLCHLPREK